MGNQTHWRLLAGMLSAVLLGGCGGGGGGGPLAGIDGSGAKPDLSVTGPINGFGSVIVNGVHYDTDNAKILVRGEPADEVELSVGDYVTVVGGTNAAGEAVAYEVHYYPRVTGEVQWVDKDSNRFAVLGQVIQLLGDTVYSSDLMPRNIDGLRVGLRVSVSGPLDADRMVQATRLETDENLFVELVGLVEDLNRLTREFILNGQVVSYSAALASDQLMNGRLVGVRGTLNETGALVADELNFAQDYRQLRSVPAIELVGFAQRLNAQGGFYLDSVPVKVTPETRYTDGMGNNVAVNTKVRVVGALDAADVLVAKEVAVLSPPSMKNYGEIEEIHPVLSSAGILGKVRVDGHEFEVHSDTRLTGQYEQRISFRDLHAGDLVYLSAYARPGKLVANSLAVDNRDMRAVSTESQGKVELVAPLERSFKVFMTTVRVTNETLYSRSGIPLMEREFFRAASGSYVRVRGHHEGDVLVADHVQIFSPEVDGPFGGDPNCTTGLP